MFIQILTYFNIVSINKTTIAPSNSSTFTNTLEVILTGTGDSNKYHMVFMEHLNPLSLLGNQVALHQL